MGNELTFRIILVVLIIGFIGHRGYYTQKNAASNQNTLKQRETGWASRLAGVLSLIGFIAMIAYAINPGWISWAAIALAPSVRWIGVGIAVMGFGLLQWAQNALGKNWSDTPRMMKEQRLVTSGPYQWIRHPIYSAFILILGATLFISANWLIGSAWIGMTILEIASRIRFEEAIMMEYFSGEYRDYMKRTGRFFPRLG